MSLYGVGEVLGQMGAGGAALQGQLAVEGSSAPSQGHFPTSGSQGCSSNCHYFNRYTESQEQPRFIAKALAVEWLFLKESVS